MVKTTLGLIAFIAIITFAACEGRIQNVENALVVALEAEDLNAFSAAYNTTKSEEVQAALLKALDYKNMEAFREAVKYADIAAAQTATLKALDLGNGSAFVLAYNYAGPDIADVISANYNFPGGVFSYQLDNDGGITITGYNGTNPILVIPSSIEGYPVKRVGRELTRTGLSAVIVSEGIEEIMNSAFYRQRSLRIVVLPDTVHRIGTYAFYECGRLTDINLPAGIKAIGQGAFIRCGELYNLTIPKSVSRIDFRRFFASGEPAGSTGDQFMGCSKLPLATRQRLRDLGYLMNFNGDF